MLIQKINTNVYLDFIYYSHVLLIPQVAPHCVTRVVLLLHMYSSDVRPGVPMVKRMKDALRKEAVQKEKNTQNRQKSFREQERESREAALQSSISSQNKGFALLQKMGYKAGQGLGKQGQWLIGTYPKLPKNII